ncbi:MAG: pyruvate kinase alpha/beta domain-containing protein [Bacillota bacterium]|nr:pyruvate kinase alpha/beta domain-containing protein [Bacillota bacterium]
MIYFSKPGKDNTESTIEAAIAVAKAQNINKIVVASTSGATASLLLDRGFDVSVVTHQAGYSQPGAMEISRETIDRLQAGGMKIITGTHFFAGADRAVNRKFQGIYPGELMAHTLRILGQGFKVCVEVAIMAMDAGHIKANSEVVAIGGAGKGADTAVILTPAHSQDFFDTDVKEIICMPRGHRK